MLFLWFHSTVRLPGNEIGSVLGKLKSEVIKERRSYLIYRSFYFLLVCHSMAEISREGTLRISHWFTSSTSSGIR